MRLRKLGQGQSLMFLAPPEVHQQISARSKHNAHLNAYDVVAWSLEQSCQSIERAQPLRVLQGLNYSQRQNVMQSFMAIHPNLDDTMHSIDPSNRSVTLFREKEQQRLKDLYAPLYLTENISTGVVEASRSSSNRTVQRLLELWEGIDASACEKASMHEEHEREIAHEVEQETQVERPAPAKPLTPKIDPALWNFVVSGSSDNFGRFGMAYSNVTAYTSSRMVKKINPWVSKTLSLVQVFYHIYNTQDSTFLVWQRQAFPILYCCVPKKKNFQNFPWKLINFRYVDPSVRFCL